MTSISMAKTGRLTDNDQGSDLWRPLCSALVRQTATAPDLYRHRFRDNPVAEDIEQGAGGQHIDRDAKQILQFNLNGGHVHQRHFRGRVDKDIQIAFSGARAAQDRVEQPRVEHLGLRARCDSTICRIAVFSSRRFLPRAAPV